MPFVLSVRILQSLATLLFTRVRVLRTVAVRASPSVSVTSNSSHFLEYEAFFLGRAEARGSSSEPYTFYAGTNNALLSFNRINATTTHNQLAGCNLTDSAPFSWNYTLPDTGPVAEHVDSAGGKTSFYLPTATAAEPYMGAIYHQTGTGLIQIYEARGAAMLQNAPDAGGQQPPYPYAR